MFKLQVTGFNNVKQQFISATENIREIVDQELESMAQQWKAGAIRDAPGDIGTLRQGISYAKKGANIEIFSNSFYSPFMEFGTKGKYRAIPGAEAIAAQFKGYKGSGDIFLAIKKWVIRKGIGAGATKSGKPSKSQNSLSNQNRVAWLIAMSILKNGVRPHPFFFKQAEVVWPDMVRRVKQRIDSKVSVIMPGDIFRPNIVTI